MSNSTAVDVAIIGNGILGLSIARELMSRDATLTIGIIGPAARPGAASTAAGVMLNSFAEVTKYTFASPAGRAKFDLGERALRRWPTILEELNLRPTGRGTHVIVNTQSGLLDDENFAAMRAAVAEYGPKCEEAVIDSIPGLAPLPTARPLRGIYFPEEVGIEGSLVVDAMAAHLVNAGAVFIDDAAKSLVVDGSRVSGVVLDTGDSVSAGVTIVAAGVFSQPLLETAFGLGATIPLVAGVGVAVVGRRVLGAEFETVVRTVNRSGSCGLHVVPLGGRREYFGATNVVFRWPEAEASVGMSHFLATCAMEQLDRSIFYHRIESPKVGNRPVPLDMFPLLGPGPAEGVFIATGTYRDGFQCSPEIAAYLASWVLDGRPAVELPFSPTRRPMFEGTAAASIDEFVHQCISGAYENFAHMPAYSPVDALAPWFRERAAEVMSALDTDVALPPDLLQFLALNRRSDEDLLWVREALRSTS